MTVAEFMNEERELHSVAPQTLSSGVLREQRDMHNAIGRALTHLEHRDVGEKDGILELLNSRLDDHYGQVFIVQYHRMMDFVICWDSSSTNMYNVLAKILVDHMLVVING